MTERELELLGIIRDLQKVLHGRHLFMHERATLDRINTTLDADFADVQEERNVRAEKRIIALGWKRDGNGWSMLQ